MAKMAPKNRSWVITPPAPPPSGGAAAAYASPTMSIGLQVCSVVVWTAVGLYYNAAILRQFVGAVPGPTRGRRPPDIGPGTPSGTPWRAPRAPPRGDRP